MDEAARPVRSTVAGTRGGIGVRANGATIHATGEPMRDVVARTPWATIVVGWVIAYGLGAFLAFVVRALGWWENGAPWERQALAAAQETVSPALDVIMLTLPYAGTNYTLAPIVAIVAFYLWRKGWTTVALHLLVLQAGSWSLNPALKFSFPRDRPTLFEARGQHAFPAFPSGHAIAVAAVLLGIAYIIHRTGHGTWAYWVVGAFFLLNSYSRIYLSVHWPTDVIAGALIGLVWLWFTVRAFRPVHR
jgi:undecaprenyl-diphosphatase